MFDSTWGSLGPSPMKTHQSMWIKWPSFAKTWTKGHQPLDDLWPHVCWGHMCYSTQGTLIVSKSHENTSKYVDTVTLFSKTRTKGHLTPRWPLNPCLLRSHVWLYQRIIVSKSHGNTSMYMYVDTVINFAKWSHTTCTLQHTTYYVQNEWSQSLTELSSGETITELSSGETKKLQ